MLKKAKTSPVGLLAWLIPMAAFHILLFRDKVGNDYPVAVRILYLLLAVIIVLPAHELIHFLLIKVFIKGPATIEFTRDPLGLPTLRTIAQGSVTNRWQKAVFLLAPFVLLTVVPDVVFVFSSRIELILFIVVVGNSVGCYYDIIDTLLTLNESP